ncbi:FHA domain-containing protein [Nocardioides hwasunensis]|uniref:FHA domain-containing protein n=1 Tax=Nocardioides hwasunensis TaxID=397258 RepID=UPI002964B2AC|nr:FHA domain-containing protein [Nocardioides hwasunensis]
MEATYAGGTGVLLGSGAHWVLLTDPGDEQVVQSLWDALSTATGLSDAPVVEQVMAIVEKAFDGDPPGLALVDFTSGASTTLSRGSGHVRLAGPSRVLSLDHGADPDHLRGTRRLVGGVVAADRVVLTPLSARTAPAARATEVPAPPASAALIDGIPAAILAAKGPDGPPPRARVRQRAEDTGSLMDTSEPDPLVVERIEEGTRTTIRSESDPHTAPGSDPEDHDGSTTLRPSHLSHHTSPTVLAVSCPLGHLTPPASPQCRVCHQRVAPQEPRRVERPSLGGLRLPTGEVVPLDRGVILGRKPAPAEGSVDWPHLVHLPRDHSFVSRRHLHVELDGWDVVARDLDSRGGTTIATPGREPERMRPGDAYVLEPGTVLDMAHVYAVRFETGAVAR